MTDPGSSDRRGMILAAGYGRRLLPLTRHLPKPLLPVLDVPLLARAGQALRAAGITTVAANTHHLSEQIESFARADAGELSLTLHHEPEILGTGGALHGARDFLAAADSFVLYNGDVLCDLDLRELVAAHEGQKAGIGGGNGGEIGVEVEATLALVDWPQVNSVRLAADGRVVRIGDAEGHDRGDESVDRSGDTEERVHTDDRPVAAEGEHRTGIDEAGSQACGRTHRRSVGWSEQPRER